MPLELAIGAFFVAAFLALYVLQLRLIERRTVYRNLRHIDTLDVTNTDLRRRELAAPVTSRVILPALRRVTSFLGRATPATVLARLDEQLAFAGNPPTWDAERVLALKIVGTVLGLILGLVLGPVLGLPALRVIIIAALLTFVGYYAPEWVLRSVADSRQQQIQRALPDALDLLSISVEAGLGFDAAVDRVARQMDGPLSDEFTRVVQEMRLGKSRADSLRDLGDRTSVAELKAFVLAMVQADIFGVAIANVLQIQATEMRVKRRQRAEEKAQKLPVKIVFPLILCIFPSLFVVLLGPAAINIYENIVQR